MNPDVRQNARAHAGDGHRARADAPHSRLVGANPGWLADAPRSCSCLSQGTSGGLPGPQGALLQMLTARGGPLPVSYPQAGPRPFRSTEKTGTAWEAVPTQMELVWQIGLPAPSMSLLQEKLLKLFVVKSGQTLYEEFLLPRARTLEKAGCRREPLRCPQPSTHLRRPRRGPQDSMGSEEALSRLAASLCPLDTGPHSHPLLCSGPASGSLMLLSLNLSPLRGAPPLPSSSTPTRWQAETSWSFFLPNAGNDLRTRQVLSERPVR